MPQLFDYLDYREFLRDQFQYSKQSTDFFSYRYVGLKTGIDPSHYSKVLQKQKHLGDSAVDALLQLLKFSKKQEEYFRTLVQYNKARKPELASHYFEQLLSMRESTIHTLEKSTYDYFSAWYNIPLRELLNVYDFIDDYAQLASRLEPPISSAQAQASIALLGRLGLISRQEDGTWKPTQAVLSTGASWHDSAITNFQREIMKLGMESLDRLPRSRRDISTLTVSTSKECLQRIAERLAQVRKEILEMVRAEEAVDGVYQLNFQCFALSTPERGAQGE